MFNSVDISVANQLVEGIELHTVPEFSYRLRAETVENGLATDVVVANSRMRFEAPSASNPPDTTVVASVDVLRSAFFDQQPSVFAAAFDDGTATVEGDFGRLRAFSRGLLAAEHRTISTELSRLVAVK